MLERLQGERIFSNAQMTLRLIRKHCRIDSECERMPEQAMTRLGLSARAPGRILKAGPLQSMPEEGDLDIEIIIYFCPAWYPFKRRESFRFITKVASDGQIHWLPRPDSDSDSDAPAPPPPQN